MFSEEEHNVVRPRRATRLPCHLADYDVILPRRHRNTSSHSTEEPEDTPAEFECSPTAMVSALREIQEENKQLRQEMKTLLSAVTSLKLDTTRALSSQQGSPKRLNFQVDNEYALSSIGAHHISAEDLDYQTQDDLDYQPLQEIQPPPVVLHEADETWPPPPPPITYMERKEQTHPLRRDGTDQQCCRHDLRTHHRQVIQARFHSHAPHSPVNAEPYTSPKSTLIYPSGLGEHQQFSYGQRPTSAVHDSERKVQQVSIPHNQELTYRGPKPSIPDFTRDDPRQFARLKIALDNILPVDSTERFKFQILTDHLKLEDALLIADSYSNSLYPYSDTMATLMEHYGQPHKLALQRIAEVLDGPAIKSGDIRNFRTFALKVRSLVGMLDQLGKEGATELQCGSHVARLLAKLPHDIRANFRRFVNPIQKPIPTLLDFSGWLEYEVRVQDDETKFGNNQAARVHADQHSDRFRDHKPIKSGTRTTTVLLGCDPPSSMSDTQITERPKKYCPFCDNIQHYFNQCSKFKALTKDQKLSWIKRSKRCWRCGREHLSAHCYLRAKCQVCKRRHLEVLHELNDNSKDSKMEGSIQALTTEFNSQPVTYYLDHPTGRSCVLLKLVKVMLTSGTCTLETYAILDDGSERTMLLHSAAQKLCLEGPPEDLALRTIRHDVRMVKGNCVSFSVSPITNLKKRFNINNAFTAVELGLSVHTQPSETLQSRYRHLRGLSLQSFSQAQPLLLIGSDCPHLITPIEPVRLGPPGGPAALKTRLGWTLQGPSKYLCQTTTSQCLWTKVDDSSSELLNNVTKLWQMDVLPYQHENLVTRSKQDTDAMQMLEKETVRVHVDDAQRYATPLLWKRMPPCLQAQKKAVLGHLRSTEKRLSKDPLKAAKYNTEIQKLLDSGYISKLPPEEHNSPAWYIPHHMVHHNGKDRIVFNCSFKYQGESLNEQLLPGPSLGATLLEVLLRFREYPVAICSDIKSMFHQIRLLPRDKPFLRFLWREINCEESADVYEWQVLPFGTTCSPCCAIFSLQKHVHDHSYPGDDVRHSIDRSFYVDNLLQSFPSISEAKETVDKLYHLLHSGGFELRQWASNVPSTISHLPKELRSESSELWFTEGADPQERALGLLWQCATDTISYSYKFQQCGKLEPTMRNIYRTLASQYDPLGYLIPYTTRAKVLVQRLWDKKREWDDPQLPDSLRETWNTWVDELPQLTSISLPRCYVHSQTDCSSNTRSIHVFSDASEKAYGSVAYLRTENQGHVQVAFLSARSRVAPKRQQSIPRLELCAAHAGAQLGAMLQRELTLHIDHVTYWTDSTTVLNWLVSESCRYKVFVGTRVANIQELTHRQEWRYVPSDDNPADDITRGKPLGQLVGDSRWSQGPEFLMNPETSWPVMPDLRSSEVAVELRKSSFCGHLSVDHSHAIPDVKTFSTYKALLQGTALAIHGAASNVDSFTAEDYEKAEISLLRHAQAESFPEEYAQLSTSQTISSSSRLLPLAPEFDKETQLIRVGGRLRKCGLLDPEVLHPVVLSPQHHLTKLIIQDFDVRLCHPGPERVFAEIRRRYWILRGRAAVRKHQYNCVECRRWRGKPEIPKMADLPPSSLRLYHPAFYSTGIDCFGPFLIKIGRRNEKRWGILFKCLTTRAIHLDILSSIDTDSFLLALRRFIARRGKPYEVISDQGTNFRGGSTELQEAFHALEPSLKSHLASQQIRFQFNPPNAPHFGGSWEREIRSIKAALYKVLGGQTVSEEVLRTLLIEVEGIINSKPLGYVSSDVADVDPITPNVLLMGRLDPAMPQVMYPSSDLFSRRRWKRSQVLADQFWSCFVRNFLPTLQIRQKWKQDTANLTVGQVVMIIDQQLPRALWPVGKVTDVMPGSDGKIRAVHVQVKDRVYTRPVARLITLPALPEDSS